MKKIFCLLLVAVMLFSLCGCFGNEKGPEFSLGKTENSTYKNDFLGISCTLPADWVFYTDEQILALNNMVGEVLDEEAAARLEQANIVYDMYAATRDAAKNININMEKLNALQLVSLNIKQTLEAQIGSIKSAYQNMGYTDIHVEYQKVTVDGKEFDGLVLTAKIQGFDFYATIFTFKKSNYLANVTVCSLQTDATKAILGYFTVQ